MKAKLALRRIALALAAMAAVIAGWYLIYRPTTLVIAIGPGETSQHRFAANLARLMRETKQPFRLKLLTVSGSAEASAALDQGRADIAVVRSDDLSSKDARSIVIIHRRSLLLLAHKEAGIESLRDAADKKIAIVAPDTDSFRPLVERLLAHYDISEEDIDLEEIGRDDAAAAIAERKVDAILLFSNPAARPVRELVTDIVSARNVPIAFSGAPAHEALALRFKELQTIEIPAGIFGGNPERPEEDINTVAITFEIAATSRLADRTATALTKSLLDLRSRLRSAANDQTYVLETPPVDEPRGIVPHAGTAAFVNNEATTWLDDYSEYIWLGMFAIGIVGSGIAAILSWAGFYNHGSNDHLAGRLRTLAARLECATTTEDVEEIQGDFDDLVLSVLRDEGVPAAREGGADPALWLTSFGALLERRKSLLEALAKTAEPTPRA